MEFENTALTDSVPRKPYTVFLWVPFVWYAIISTRSVSYWLLGRRGAGEFDYLEGSPLDRSIFLLLIAIGTAILISRRVPWSRVFRENIWLFTLLLYMLISILWSNFPEVAIKRWVKVLGSVLMAMIVMTEPVPKEAVSSLIRRVLLIHIPLDVVLVKYFRTIGVGWDQYGMEMWTGLTRHKNNLGQVCMIGGMYFIWNLFRNKTKKGLAFDLVYLAMIFYLMRGSGDSRSASSILLLCIGVLVFFFIQISPQNSDYINKILVKRIIILFLAFVFVTGGVAAYYSDRPISQAVLTASGRDTTLTGRTELWKDILTYASKNPITGVGYGSFWIGNKANLLWDKYFWHPNQGHNGYLDIYVELGVIGLFLFGGVLVSTARKIKNMLVENAEFGRFQIALFVMIVAHNLTESSFLRGDNDLWFIFLLIALTVSFRGGEEEAGSADPEESYS